jgi:hypothetical protein
LHPEEPPLGNPGAASCSLETRAGEAGIRVKVIIGSASEEETGRALNLLEANRNREA